MKKGLRKTLILTVKLLVAAVLLTIVLSKARWDDYDVITDGQEVHVRGFRTTITSANPYLLAGAFVCFLTPVLIISVRWWYLLRVQQIDVPLTEAVRLTFLGTFFNYVIPGTVSGDLVKAYYASRHTDRKAAALMSIFMDRALGFLEFAAFPAVVIVGMYATGADGTDRLATPAIIVAAILIGVTFSLAVILSSRFRQMLRVGKIIRRLPLQRHIATAAEAARIYRRRPAALAKVFGLTFCGQGIFIVAVMLTAFSLGLDIPPHRFFLYVPLIYIIAAVPVSPGAVGVAEAFYVTFFAVGGISPSEVLALALVARLIPMICSLPGLVVILTGPAVPRVEQMRAELGE